MAAPITLPDEIADALPAQPVETILVDTLTYAECGACPEHGPVADAIATVAHTGPESDLVYREGACAEHLAEVVRYELRIRHNKVWIEAPRPVVADAPSARSLCRCRTPEHGCTWCTEGDEDRGYTAAEYLAARDDRDAS